MKLLIEKYKKQLKDSDKEFNRISEIYIKLENKKVRKSERRDWLSNITYYRNLIKTQTRVEKMLKCFINDLENAK